MCLKLFLLEIKKKKAKTLKKTEQIKSKMLSIKDRVVVFETFALHHPAPSPG